MTDIYQLILDELREGGAAHVDRFPPFYIISIGAHLLNLHNKTTHIYVQTRRTPDLRTHTLFVAPQGAEKSFWIEQFLRGEQAILLDSTVDIGFLGTISEAGFVGIIKFINGEKQTVPGICMKKATAIFGCEEFSAISESLKTEYAKTLDPALLGALDSGWVYKSLAAGDLNYETRLTLWAGTQPARFDLRGGMGRRFIFIYYAPTSRDWRDITMAMRGSKNVPFNPMKTDRIRKEIAGLTSKLQTLEHIRWGEDVYKFYDNMKFLPYEELLYDKMLLGYLVMTGRFDKELFVTLDDNILNILKKEAYYRDTIRRGSEFAEILLILRENDGKMPLFKLKDELLAFGKDWVQSAKLIENLIRIRAVKRTMDNMIELSPQLKRRKRV